MRIHNLGLPRIGLKRELKRSLEKYWKNDIDLQTFLSVAKEIRSQNVERQLQSGMDFITVGDFSLYDQVLDNTIMFNNIPKRFNNLKLNNIDLSFALARGTTTASSNISPSEMQKWFNTNYHYIVPEFTNETEFSLNPEKMVEEIEELLKRGVTAEKIKPVILGPLTYLHIGKALNIEKLTLLEELVKEYKKLLKILKSYRIDWVQIDEPILIYDNLPIEWLSAFKSVYLELGELGLNILLSTYFDNINENLNMVLELNISGIHLDLTQTYSEQLQEVPSLERLKSSGKIISLGIVSGRNIWISDYKNILSLILPIEEVLGDKLWLAPSSSLQHIPITTELENKTENIQFLKFAMERLMELFELKEIIENNAKTYLEKNCDTIQLLKVLRTSPLKKYGRDSQRISAYGVRKKVQEDNLKLPELPTTTIGSFPQTDNIRRTRRSYRNGDITYKEYERCIKNEIADVIKIQEEIGLDVLVHGEPERTDMVEYFASLMNGYMTTQYGWVQSYGSRCVKPAIIINDVERREDMTTEWIDYAQSLTDKPVKGMLTGPVTMLKWSFVRQDIPYFHTAEQVAMELNREIHDLISRGISIIQIDEAALKEALPNKTKQHEDYLYNAARVFRLCSNGISDKVQIHTHMCYSDFSNIVSCIEKMDYDVITIETTRSDMKILNSLRTSRAVNDIGPGVYDIHSPNIPSVKEVERLITLALTSIDRGRLWINPDCGLKTRNWKEVKPSLKNMVQAAKNLRISSL